MWEGKIREIKKGLSVIAANLIKSEEEVKEGRERIDIKEQQIGDLIRMIEENTHKGVR
jgi:hypothetical protein